MAGWNLTGNAVSAEFDGSDEQERKELSVSQAVETPPVRSMPFRS